MVRPGLKTGLLLLFPWFFLQSQSQIIVTKVFRPGPPDGYGVELSTWDPDYNNRSSHSFDANAWTVGGEPITNRSLIRFDLTSIPSGKEIISAKLSLYCNPAATHYQLQAGENESCLLRVAEPWDDQTVTWNTQPAVSFDSPVFLHRSTYNTENYPDIDVLEHVKDMISDPVHNYGWEIRLLTEELYRSMQFSSCRDELEFRPKLEIKYFTCSPPEIKWGYLLRENTFHFLDSSSASCFRWQWDFGDGYSSDLQNPEHQYTSIGKYLVCLAVTDSCSTVSSCDTLDFCPDFSALFSYAVEDHKVLFENKTPGADKWFWDFGDGYYSTLKDPVHSFIDPGRFQVCLRAASACREVTWCDSIYLQEQPGGDYGDESVRLYPVPAWDDLVFEIHYPTSRVLRFKIYNDLGETLVKSSLTGYIPGTAYLVNVRNFANGMYFLEVFLENKSIVRKFIINR